jgi:hypothetical protein
MIVNLLKSQINIVINASYNLAITFNYFKIKNIINM